MLTIKTFCFHCGAIINGDDLVEHMKYFRFESSKMELPLNYENIREIVLHSLISCFDITAENLRKLMRRNGVDGNIISSLEISQPSTQNLRYLSC